MLVTRFRCDCHLFIPVSFLEPIARSRRGRPARRGAGAARRPPPRTRASTTPGGGPRSATRRTFSQAARIQLSESSKLYVLLMTSSQEIPLRFSIRDQLAGSLIPLSIMARTPTPPLKGSSNETY